jgi:hypothetical protein
MKEFFKAPFSREAQRSVRTALGVSTEPARALAVNRTHRVVRERVRVIAARRSKVRSLWIPMGVCSALLVIICTALWTALDQYDATPTGVPDASNQFLVLCLWFLPLSLALLAVVFVHRSRKLAESEAAQ